jgi:hypothetical protein
VGGLLAAAAAPAAEEARTFDWGFLASRRFDLDGNLRLNVLGPFFEFTTESDGDGFQAVRPVFSHTEDGGAERERFELVWPLCTSKRLREQTTTRLLTAIYANFDREESGSRWRLWILPFYFQGRDEDLQPYRALFPLAGSIHEVLGQDEIDFALWPLFMATRQNDIEGRHLLWPLFAQASGEGVERFRALPFYARSYREDRFEKTSFLWPFYTRAVFDHPIAYGEGYLVFPLWGHVRMNYEETWYVLPPFNRFTRGEHQNTTHILWPFFQYDAGATEKLYFWPLWGTKLQRGSRKTFFLWPLFHFQGVDQGPTRKTYDLALPFYHARDDTAVTPPRGEDSEVLSRRRNFWPLFSYMRRGEQSGFRMLDLWPFKHSGPIERNLAPFWSLYTREAKGETRESELLWGLYRHRTRGDDERYVSLFPLFSWHRRQGQGIKRDFSILKGLLGFEEGEEGRQWRLLYLLRLGAKEDKAAR